MTIGDSRASGTGRPPGLRFTGLVLTEPESLAKGHSATVAVSMVLHSVLIAAMVLIPVLIDQSLPAPGEGVHAFFVPPAAVAPPPPPPPPPAAGARVPRRAPAAPRPAEPPKFVAPIDAPAATDPKEGLDLGLEGGVPGGVVGGVEGGVEGGVPGGVVGGLIGGLPAEAPPPTVVRIGGSIVAPKLVRQVKPAYPSVATQARVRGLVILEAQVDVHGAVKSLKVLRGPPLLEEAAMEAVRQWRYQPLLLNGEPREFILTVTVVFNLAPVGS